MRPWKWACTSHWSKSIRTGPLVTWEAGGHLETFWSSGRHPHLPNSQAHARSLRQLGTRSDLKLTSTCPVSTRRWHVPTLPTPCRDALAACVPGWVADSRWYESRGRGSAFCYQFMPWNHCFPIGYRRLLSPWLPSRSPLSEDMNYACGGTGRALYQCTQHPPDYRTSQGSSSHCCCRPPGTSAAGKMNRCKQGYTGPSCINPAPEGQHGHLELGWYILGLPCKSGLDFLHGDFCLLQAADTMTSARKPIAHWSSVRSAQI